jgi:hypothetical protein
MSAVVTLPLVGGRHRNHALAAARRARAVELRTAGRTYQEIADELGYASRATVYAIVRKALQALEVTEVERHRDLEAARLDRLQRALWHRAMAGEVAAVAQVRRIIETRIRLLGLADTVPQDALHAGEICRTVVCSCSPGTGHQSTTTAPHCPVGLHAITRR